MSNVAWNCPPPPNLLQPYNRPCAVTDWFAGSFPTPGEIRIPSFQCMQLRVDRPGVTRGTIGHAGQNDHERERDRQRKE